MIIKQKPRLFTKEWKKWFHYRLWVAVFNELEKQRIEMERTIENTIRNLGAVRRKE